MLIFPSFCISSGLQKVVYQPTVSDTVQRVSFNNLAQTCAPSVHHNTLQAIARVESGFNPYAIGVVKGSLKQQPRSYAEAVATAKALHAQGKNFSMGLVQINKKNLAAYGLNYETVFDTCRNLATGAKILTNCFTRAGGGRMTQSALQKALSCYYSGNFKFGFKQDFQGQPSYVQKVVNSASMNSEKTTIKVPAIDSSIVITPPQKLIKVSSGMASLLKRQSSENPIPAQIQAKPIQQHQSWDIFQEF